MPADHEQRREDPAQAQKLPKTDCCLVDSPLSGVWWRNLLPYSASLFLTVSIRGPSFSTQSSRHDAVFPRR